METNSPEEPTPEQPPTPPVDTVVPEPIPEPSAEVAPAETPAETDAPEAAASEEAPGEEDTPSTGETAPDAAPDELGTLAEASQRARLAPADEERMGVLIKEALLGGRAGVARAVEVLPRVPWIVGVRAVETIWPELTAGFRTQLLAGLAKEDSDAARRIRLSLARALFKIDVAVALKAAVGVARELRDKETGALTPKQAQIFANVFIGRGKPWLAQLPLTELKPAEVDALVHCAVLAVYTLPHPPMTQLGVLKWVQEQGRLGKLDTVALEIVKKGVTRWSGKWQNALRREVAELPEEILVILKPAAEEKAPEAREPRAPDEDADVEAKAPAETPQPKSALDDEDEDDDDDLDDEDDEDEDEEEEKERKERPVYEPRPQKPPADSNRERPVYTPRNAGGNVPKNFNLNESLRNIEAYAQSLRTELAAAQAKARQKDDRRRPEKQLGPIIEGEPTLEELARLNQQLEARNTELQERITELKQHSEDVAASAGVLSGEPAVDPGTQLRALLALKLQEDFADFLALQKESNDIVVQQHYRSLLSHVFEVLQQLEVPLKATPPES